MLLDGCGFALDRAEAAGAADELACCELRALLGETRRLLLLVGALAPLALDLLLGSVALVPVSQVIAGALVTVSLSGMLVTAGLTMALFTLVAAVTPTARGFGLEPALEQGTP